MLLKVLKYWNGKLSVYLCKCICSIVTLQKTTNTSCVLNVYNIQSMLKKIVKCREI